MTIRDLDRLVSKTEMTPTSKTMLRRVRKAVMSGQVVDSQQRKGTWTVALDSDGGSKVTMSFSFKRDS